MAFFKEAPIKSLTRDRDAAKANVDRLAVKMTEAEQAIISAKTASQAAALSGDDANLDRLEAAERAAQHRHGTLRAAHAEAGAMLSFLEESIATVTDQKIRAATAATTLSLADEYNEVMSKYYAVTALAVDVSGRMLPVTLEANGSHVFFQQSILEIGAATPVITEAARQYARAVTNHQAPAAFPTPAPPPAKPIPAPAKAPTVRVFTTRPIKYLDQDGKQVSSGKCVDLDLPVAVAERALSSGACVKLDNPLRAGNLGRWPGNYSLGACYDLDAADAAAPQHDPLVHSAFQPLPGLRAPFQLKVAAGGA